MTKHINVYGVTLGISRQIVAATSKSAARAALGLTYYTFNTYGCKTGNQKEIEIAMAEPGQVFVESLRKQWEGFVKKETLEEGRF